MPCENCNAQFTIFKHKKACSECRRLFCLNCLQKSRRLNLCARCVIFTRRPLKRSDLQRLKPKDLIVYLQSKHIPTAGCLEKEDLVNLVLSHESIGRTGATSPSPSPSPSDSSGSHSFRSYLNQFASPRTSNAAPQNQPRSSSSSGFFGSVPGNTNGSGSNGSSTNDNPFSFLRQSCQVIFDNVTDRLVHNLNKFETPTASQTPSSATSPATSSQPQGDSSPQRRANAQAPTTATGSTADSVASPAQSHSSSTVNRPRQRQRPPELGCECSDDEDSKLRTMSQSASNLLDDPLPEMALPGPSGCHNRHVGVGSIGADKNLQSKGSTLSDSSEFSSFEELTVERKAPLLVARTGNKNMERYLTTTGRGVITRRRSEGCLYARMDMPRELSTNKFDRERGCCSRCGRRKNELKKRLKRFHDQLNGNQDIEVRRHLEAILKYLDRGPLSNTEASAAEEHIDGQEESVPTNILQTLVPEDIPAGTVQEEKKPEVIYRRFVKLDEIQSSADLEELSVKQLKEILVLNRVDFKGCCEKTELQDRLRRLLEDYHAAPPVEKLTTDDLCKICMDAPIECVILECGHLATCTSCGKILSECPICRQFIIRVVRFFRA